MSTQAYDRIQAKLRLSGREYLEGLSSADFSGLTESELASVQEALKLRCEQEDGVSLDALRQSMPRDEFLSFVRGLFLSRTDARLFSAQLATAIYEVEPDDSVWLKLLSLLEDSDQAARRWIVNRIQVETLSADKRSGLVDVLAGLVQKESDSALLLSEAVTLLLAIGFKPRSAELVEYTKRLQGTGATGRTAVLAELIKNGSRFTS